MIKKYLLASASMGIALACCANVAAQENDAAPENESPQNEQANNFSEIIVTASRREESIQDIPLNIAAIGGAQIQEQGLTELGDLLAFVPGINVNDRGGRQGNPIIARGINADGLGPGDGNNNGGGTVATYLGDIPVFLDLKLNDLQRVEVLLGPQGTLYGSGTLGGAIRYIPNAPDFNDATLEFRSELSFTKESANPNFQVGVTANKPLTDRLAFRASVDYTQDAGFIDQPFRVITPGVSNPDPDFNDPADVANNLQRARDTNGENVVSGRAALRWEPTDWLDGTLTYYFQESDVEGRSVSSFRSILPTARFENNLRVAEPNFTRNQLLALEIEADLGFAELTSATGFSRFADEGQRDQTDLLITLEYSYEAFPSFTAFTFEEGRERRFNQEFRLVSTHGGPISWILGAFYNDFDSFNSTSEFTPFFSQSPQFGGTTPREDNLEFFSESNNETIERAIFGEVAYKPFDRLTLTVGGRLFDYEVQSVTSTVVPFFDDPAFQRRTLDEIRATAFDPALFQSDSGFLFKGNVSFEASDDLLLYATVSEGFRVGASNGQSDCPDIADQVPGVQLVCGLALGQQFLNGATTETSVVEERFFGPDRTVNYELGFKSTLLDGRATFNGALFYVDWQDPQLAAATANGNNPITINAQGAESYGVELSSSVQATDNLNLRGSFSYTKAQLSDLAPALIRSIAPPGFSDVFIDGQSGDRLPGSPEFQFSVFASYNQPLNNGDSISFNTGYAWQSDVLTRTGSRGEGFILGAYGLANASVNYKSDTWQLGLFIDNIFNEFAETGVRDTPLFNQIVSDANGDDVNVRRFFTSVLSPRVIGLRLNYKF